MNNGESISDTISRLRPVLAWQIGQQVTITAGTSWVCFDIDGERTTVRSDLDTLRNGLAAILLEPGNYQTIRLSNDLKCRYYGISRDSDKQFGLRMSRGGWLRFDAEIGGPVLRDLLDWLALLDNTRPPVLGENYRGVTIDNDSIMIMTTTVAHHIRTTERSRLARQLLSAVAGCEDNSDPCMHKGIMKVIIKDCHPRPSIQYGLSCDRLSRTAMVHLAASLEGA